jgi:DNA-binding NarL/FixJ family response regulator
MERPDAILSPTRWRLLIVDAHALVCVGMAMMFRTMPEVAEVAVATLPSQAIRIGKLLRPHVAVVDAAMPAQSGFEIAQWLLASPSECRVVFLDNEFHERRVRWALNVGAMGYWTKHATFDEIVGAVRRVAEGHIAFCPEVQEHLNATFGEPPYRPSLDAAPSAGLSPFPSAH